MRAVQVARTGGPEVLEVVDAPEPEPAAGEVLVRVAAAGVNYIDTYHRSGLYPQPLPLRPGLEGAGEVVAVGAEVQGVAAGDRVAWFQGPGSYAELVAVPEAAVVPVPADVPLETAAALLLQGVTAHYLATAVAPVRAGEWYVVHAAAGGVGLLLTQVVRLRGGHVLATTSSEEKADLARAAGADEVVRYDGFEARARELTGGEGVPAVFDGVGATTFEASLDALRPRGVLALYGASSGPVPPVDPQALAAHGSAYLTRPTIGSFVRTREELRTRTGDLLGWVADGRLSVRVGATHPLADVRRAHEDLEGRRTTGKVLLVP